MDRHWWTGLDFWVEALRTWAVRGRWPIQSGTLAVEGADGARRAGPYQPGAPWGEAGAERATLELTATVPVDRPRLVLDLDGEALLRIDQRAVWGVNPTHAWLDLDLPAGRSVSLVLELSRQGLMGRRIERPAVRSVAFHAVDAVAWTASWDLAVLAEWGRDANTPATWARELAGRLAQALEPLTDLPADADAWRGWLRRTGGGADDEALFQTLIVRREAVDGLNAIEPALLTGRIQEAALRLAAVRAWLSGRYPKSPGRIVAMGHAHIDWAWLWRVADTRRKVVRTLASQTALLDRYPEWVYGMSSPAMWQSAREDAPELAGRAARRAREGRILPLGAFWVESDGQLPQAASYLRHLAYTFREFHRLAGRVAPVAFLPDTFGFAAPLPTLLGAAGVDLLVTTKINWNDTTVFPYKDFWWVGPDGTRVQAHIFGQCAGGYNGAATVANIREAWDRYQAEGGRRDQVLYTFGQGDGGGGPDAGMLERLARYRELPGLPEIVLGGPDQLRVAADAEDGLPRYRGELYLEFHRGVFTTQTRVKREMRRLESRLVAVEAWRTWLGERGSWQALWTRLLANQFHDILPGSAIGPVYEDWERDHATLTAALDAHQQDIAAALAGPPDEPLLLVLNPAGVEAPPRLVTVTAGDPFRIILDGEDIASEPTWDGRQVVALPATPALGAAGYALAPADPAPPPVVRPLAEPFTVAWADGTATVRAGGICSLTWRGRELLAQTAGVVGFYNHPSLFDAWEVDRNYRRNPVAWAHEAPVLLEDGAYRAVVGLRHRAGASWVEERIVIDKRHGGVGVELAPEVHDRHLMLRYEVPTVLTAPRAEAETLYGTVSRPTEPGGPEDAARFEWVAHRFVDLSEAGRGLALINDGRFGHSVDGGRIGVTISTAPLYPDPAADVRPAPVRLLLWPHDGDWRAGGVLPRAHAWSMPTVTVRTLGRTFAPRAPVAGLPPNLWVMGFKPTEDGQGIMLYLGETHGASGCARLTVPWALARAGAADLVTEAMGDEAGPVRLSPGTGTFDVEYRPHGLVIARLDPLAG